MKVIVKFVKANGMYAPGDVTQLDIDEAKIEEERHNLIIIQELANDPIPAKYADKLPEISEEDKLICPICGKQFKNEKALKMHKLKAHKLS